MTLSTTEADAHKCYLRTSRERSIQDMHRLKGYLLFWEECIKILSFKSIQFKENGKTDVFHKKVLYLTNFPSLSEGYNNRKGLKWIRDFLTF